MNAGQRTTLGAAVLAASDAISLMRELLQDGNLDWKERIDRTLLINSARQFRDDLERLLKDDKGGEEKQ